VSEEDEISLGSGESSEELETPALKSSLEEHRIVDVQKPVPGPSKQGEPQEETRTPPSSVKKNDRREDGELWPSLEEQRRRAEEEYNKLGGLSHGCRQSWDLRMREEKGPGRKINGLFCWTAKDSLILHEVARAAGLESRGYGKMGLPVRERHGIYVCVLRPTDGLERGSPVPVGLRGGLHSAAAQKGGPQEMVRSVPGNGDGQGHGGRKEGPH
jgi:hypothetical protein